MTLDEQLANLARLMETMDTHLKAVGGTIEKANSTIDSVNICVQDGFQSLHQRLDYQGTRLEQHANQITARSDWADSQDEWREQTDTVLDQHEQILQDLKRRIAILEGRKVQ